MKINAMQIEINISCVFFFIYFFYRKEKKKLIGMVKNFEFNLYT